MRYDNFPYLKINPGDYFGLMDIVLAIEQRNKKTDESDDSKNK